MPRPCTKPGSRPSFTTTSSAPPSIGNSGTNPFRWSIDRPNCPGCNKTGATSPPELQATRLQIFLDCNQSQPFNLHTPPLMRLALLQVGDRQHHLICAYHHLILDGWSAANLLKTVFTQYLSVTSSPHSPIPPSPHLPDPHLPDPHLPTHPPTHPPIHPSTPPPPLHHLPHLAPIPGSHRRPNLLANLPPGLPGTQPPAHLDHPLAPIRCRWGSPHRATAPPVSRTDRSTADLRPAAPDHPEHPDSGSLRPAPEPLL